MARSLKSVDNSTPAAASLASLIALATKASVSAPEIQAALEAARAAVSEAQSDRDRAESEYRTGLLVQDEAGLQRLIEAKSAAAIRRDRAAALVETLEDRFGEISANETEKARVAAYAKARKLGSDATAAILDQYPRLARQVRDLLRQIAEAELAIDAVNKDLPAGAEHLPSPEIAARGRPIQPEQILSEKIEARWVHPMTMQPVDDAQQRTITAQPDGTGFSSTSGLTFYRGTFRRIVFLRAVAGDWPRRFANSITMPGLREDHLPEWSALTYLTDSADVLSALSDIETDLANAPDPEIDVRRPETRFVPTTAEEAASLQSADEREAA